MVKGILINQCNNICVFNLLYTYPLVLYPIQPSAAQIQV